MPLKHLTETVLVVILAVVTIVTGVVLSILPGLPEGFFPWTAVFIVTVLYPAVLYPLLRSNRADYSFRALHFAPAAMAVGWVLLQILMLKQPGLRSAYSVFTWGWSALAVVLIFVFLAVYCLHVIRRRVPRMALLALLLLPFLVVAYASERYTHWDTTLASLLWGDQSTGGPLIAGNTSSRGSSASMTLSQSSKGEKNLSVSSVPEEEAWREKLRAVEAGKVHPMSVESSRAGISAATALSTPRSAIASASPSGSSSVSSSSVQEGKKTIASHRKNLPKSGRETEALALLFVAAFCGVLHQRARRLCAA